MSLQDDYGVWLKNLWKTQSSGEFKILQDGTLIALRRGPIVSFQYFSWANQLVKPQKGFYLIYWQRLLLRLLDHWREAKPCYRLSQIYQWVKTNPQDIDWSYRYSLFKPNPFYSNLRQATDECSRLTCKINPTKELIRDVKTKVKCEAKGGCWVASTTKKKGQRCLKGGRLRFVSDKLEKRVLKELKSQIPKSLMGWLKIMIDDALMKNILISGGTRRSVGSGPLAKVLRLPSKSPRMKLSPAEGDSYIQSRIDRLQSYTRRMMTIIQKAGFCSAYASSKKDDTACKRRAKKYETVIHQVEDMSRELIRCHAIHGSNQEQVLGCIRETNGSIEELGRQIEEIEDQVFKMDTKLKRSVKAKSPDKEEGEPRPSDWSIKWMLREILGLVAASVSAMFAPWRWVWNKTKDYIYRAKEWAKGNQLQAILVVLVLAAFSFGVITTSWGGVLLSLVEPSFWLLFDVYMWWCSRTWLDKFFYTLGAMAIDLILKGLTPENSRLLKAIRKIKDMVLFVLHLMTPFCMVTNLFGDKLKRVADKVRNRNADPGQCKPCGEAQAGDCEKFSLKEREKAEAKVQEAEAKVKEAETKVQEAEAKVKEAEATTNALQNELDKAKSMGDEERRKLEEELTAAQKAAASAGNDSAKAQEQLAKITEEARTTVQAMQKKIASMEAQAQVDATEAQKEIKKIKAQAQVDATEAQKKIASMEAQAQVDATEAQKKIAEAESNAAEAQEQLNFQTEASEETIAQLKTEANEATKKVAEMKAMAERAAQEAQQTIATIKAQAEKAALDAQQTIAELRTASGKTQKVLVQTQTDLEKTSKDLAQAQDDAKNTQSKINELTRQAQMEKDQAQQTIDTLEEKVGQLNKEMGDLQTSADVSSAKDRHEMNTLEQKIQDLENTIKREEDQAQSAAQQFSQKIATLEEEKKSALEQAKLLRKTLDGEKATLGARISTLESEAKRYTTQIAQLEQDVRSKSNEMAEKISKAEAALKAQEKVYEKTIADMNVLAGSDSETATAQMAEVRKELQKARDDLTRLHARAAEAAKKAEEEIALLMGNRRDAENQIKALQENAALDLSQAKDRFEQEKKALQAEIEELKDRIKLDEISDEMAHKAEMATRQALIKRHQIQLDEMETEHRRAMSSAAKNMGLYADQARKEEQASFAGFKQELEGKLKDMERLLEDSKLEVEQQKAALQAALAKGSMDKDEATKAIKAANHAHLERTVAIIDDYENQLREQDLKFAQDLKNMEAYYQDQQNIFVTGFSSERERFLKQIQTFDTEQTQVSGQFKHYRQTIETLQTTIRRLEDQVAHLKKSYKEAQTMAQEAAALGKEGAAVLFGNATKLATELYETEKALKQSQANATSLATKLYDTKPSQRVPVVPESKATGSKGTTQPRSSPKIILTKNGFMCKNKNPLFDWKKKEVREGICKLASGPSSQKKATVPEPQMPMNMSEVLDREEPFSRQDYQNLSQFVTKGDSEDLSAVPSRGATSVATRTDSSPATASSTSNAADSAAEPASATAVSTASTASTGAPDTVSTSAATDSVTELTKRLMKVPRVESDENLDLGWTGEFHGWVTWVMGVENHNPTNLKEVVKNPTGQTSDNGGGVIGSFVNMVKNFLDVEGENEHLNTVGDLGDGPTNVIGGFVDAVKGAMGVNGSNPHLEEVGKTLGVPENAHLNEDDWVFKALNDLNVPISKDLPNSVDLAPPTQTFPTNFIPVQAIPTDDNLAAMTKEVPFKANPVNTVGGFKSPLKPST